jgi:hypothetical protein
LSLGKKLLLWSSVVAMFGAVALPAVAHHGEKVTICHRTGSATNPYVIITISEHALSAHVENFVDDDVSDAREAHPPLDGREDFILPAGQKRCIPKKHSAPKK